MFLSPLISMEHSAEDEEESFLIHFYNQPQSSHAKISLYVGGKCEKIYCREEKRAANKNNSKIAKQTPQDPN